MANPFHLYPTDYNEGFSKQFLARLARDRVFLSFDNHTRYNWDKTGSIHAEKIFSSVRDQKKTSFDKDESTKEPAI